jgi:hypothetical protein
MSKRVSAAWFVFLTLVVAAGGCTKGSGESEAPAYTVGGVVAGLTGTGLVLQNNGGDDLTVSANGTFTFTTTVADNGAYSVTVKTQPIGPSQTCTASNNAGAIAGANITGVSVVCSENAYTVGGTVSGLSGSGLALRNNGGDDLPVSANGTFTFTTGVADGAGYTVTVKTQPAGPAQTCTANNNTGVIAGAGVTDVSVICTTNAYTVGGSVSGLAGSGLVLQNNGADDITVSANGTFSFATPVADTAEYEVSVKSQPHSLSQTCSVHNGTGAVNGANVSNVTVTCSTDAFTVSATVSGLAGSGLVLQNNGGDNLAVATNGTFTFATAVADGAAYAVMVKTQPSSPSQTCTAGNNTGTMAGKNITDISIVCSASAYTVGGTVSGLTGTGLVLQNNGADDLAVSLNGSFNFAATVADGAAYAVTVKTRPASPTQACAVNDGSGTVTGANVSGITVECSDVQSSPDKIAAAETAGAIDHDTALLYILYAIIDPASLPSEYQGDDADVMIDGTMELLELAGRYDQLTADLQAKVQPFLLRPDDPQSVWNRRMNELAAASASPAKPSKYRNASLATSPTITWLSTDSSDGRIRVWRASSNPEFEDVMNKLNTEISISGMWNTEKSAMLGFEPRGDGAVGGGTDILDVYILPAGMEISWDSQEITRSTLAAFNGLTVPRCYAGAGCETFLLLNGSIGSDFDTLKSTMAHELFHAFQFNLGMSNGYRSDSGWWMEASATWAKDLVYPTNNKEQLWLKCPDNRWANTANHKLGPLDYYEFGKTAPYAAYLWPFYLTHRSGGNATKIGELWQQSASMPAIQAMANLPDWAESYKEFALWNWNQSPVLRYNDPSTESPSGEILPLKQATQHLTYDPTTTDTYTATIGLDATNITYVEMDTPSVGMKTLEFDLSAFPKKAGWGLQAIIDQRVEDWSNYSNRTFCLEAEPASKIILVASNSTIDSSDTAIPMSGTFKLKEKYSDCFVLQYDWETDTHGVKEKGRDDDQYGRAGGIAQPSGYSDSSAYTEMLAYKDGPSSGPYTDLSFYGNQAGTYTGSGVQAYMTRVESYTGYWTSQGGSINVIVTRMDAVGGIIEGTFTATLKWTADTSVTMEITNGYFRAKRVATDVWSAQ